MIRLVALRAWAPSFRKLYCLNLAPSCDHSSLLQGRFLRFGASEESVLSLTGFVIWGQSHHLFKLVSSSVKEGENSNFMGY